MTKNKNLYNKDSIRSLDPREFCRLRPGVYAGSTVYATQLAQEIFANSLDEFCIGNGNVIKVNIRGDVVEISDEGQGFLINQVRSEDGKTVFEASLSVMNTSGKYDDSGIYQATSLGLNGMGSKLSNFLSHWMEATTHRDGKFEKLYFKEGLFEKREIGKWEDKSSGTTIKWQPSEEFFEHTVVETNKLKELFETIVCLNPGLEIILNDNGTIIEYFSKNGLNDLANKKIKNTELLKNRLNINFQDGKNKLNLLLTYTNSYSTTFYPYVNNGLTEEGPHLTQIKTLITRELNKFFKDKGWLKENEDNLQGSDIQEGIFIAFNLTAPGVSYDAQTKSRIVRLDMTPFTKVIIEEFGNWLEVNEKSIKVIAEKAINARKAREAAKKARDAARSQKEKKKKKVFNPDKLKDAENLGQDSILVVCEGLSALSSFAVARDTKTVGLLGIRGKMLNTFTNPKEKIEKNEEIQLLINALGIDPNNYDASDLRYGRIAIGADADSDGYHIGLLIAVVLQSICPQFIQENRLCWLRSPLWIVKKGKEEKYYYTDAEMDAARPLLPNNCEIVRCKGVGSLSANQAQKSMFTAEHQRLDILEYSEDAIKMLKKLMGSNVSEKKNFIFNNVDFTKITE